MYGGNEKQMGEKEVSFIIPVYNCNEYLQDFVEGIQRMDTFKFEIILINDGSTDGSDSICDYLESKNANVVCIHQKNLGVSAARNRGIKAATGEYIVFLDADDNIEIEKMVNVLQTLKQDGTIDMAVYGLSFDFYHSGRKYRRDNLAPAMTGKVKSDNWMAKIAELYVSNSLSTCCNKVIKRNILIEHQLEFRKDMFLYEDMEFSLRCMACCEKIYFCPDIIYHYRQSENEGNTGKRLKRIEHIPALIGQIEMALNILMESKGNGKYNNQTKSILLSLYLVLAREKISVSNSRQIKQICEDFIFWFKDKDIQIPVEHQNFVRRLLNKQVKRLIVRRTYTAIRHSVATKIKSTGIYRKLRG